MPFIHITVEGLEEMKQRLNEITGNGGTQAQREALQTIGEFMANEMRNNVHVITGELKSSIQLSSVTDTEAVVEATADYAVYENRRTAPALTNPGPHDFADKAAMATEREGERIVREVFDRLFGNV